jgi:hypothetical protein
MLAVLRIQEHNQWHNIRTGHESWLYFHYLRDSSLLSSVEKVSDHPNRIIATERHMLAVFWNPHRFHVVAILPKEA